MGKLVAFDRFFSYNRRKQLEDITWKNKNNLQWMRLNSL